MKKILTIYYSYSGNTKKIAKKSTTRSAETSPKSLQSFPIRAITTP